MNTSQLIHDFQLEFIELELKTHFSDVELFEKNCRNQCRRDIIQGILLNIQKHKDMVGKYVFREEDNSFYSHRASDLCNPNLNPIFFTNETLDSFVDRYIRRTIYEFEQYLIDKPVKPIKTLKDVVDKFEVETYEKILKTLKQYVNGN